MTRLEATDAVAALYRASPTPRLVDVPALTFLAADGHGDPNTSTQYRDALDALFSLTYSMRFAVKRAAGAVSPLSPLEGLWWADDPAAFAAADKRAWDWTMLIRQPPEVSSDLLARARREVARKKHLPMLERVELRTIAEGPAAQVLHIGPYSTEGPTIARLHDYLREQGFTFDGRQDKHHEIYLSDPRRARPDRLRTIIRQPGHPA